MHAWLDSLGRIAGVVAVVAILAALVGCAPYEVGTVTPTPDQTSSSPRNADVGVPAGTGAARASAGPEVVGAASIAQRGIVVNGSGSVSARPDQAIVSAGVQTRAPTAQDAHDANNRAMQGIVDAIKGMGIPDRLIRTGGISLYPTSDEKNAITGYLASNSVTVTLDDVNQAGPVLDAAIKAGANTAGTVQFTLKDPTALRNQALKAAVADATAKAAVLAEAAGMALPEIVAMSEAGVSAPMPADLAGKGVAASAPAMPVEPGEVTVTAQVSVTFGPSSP